MYNLMMAGDENFWEEISSMEWEKGRFLVHTSPTIAAELGKLDFGAIAKLMSFPCLFMYEFSHSARDGIGTLHSKARVGRLLGVQPAKTGVEIVFEYDRAIAPIDSQKLSEKWRALGIDLSRNENHRTHWAVKDVDLQAVLIAAGLMLEPTSAPLPTGLSRAVQISRMLDQTNGEPVPQAGPSDAPEVDQQLPEIVRAVPKPTGKKPKVFVVHGRADGIKNEVARWLGKAGMDEVILHEHPNLGRSILTKFRDLAKDTSFAVVIATPDDVGGLDGKVQSPRARQNVILELGFFIGVLGPERVAVLRCDVGLEIPSDYSGILMIDYDARGGWKWDLTKEFKALGISFDADALF